ncbi:PAS domain S-box protein [Leptospira fletcheri]|uniref:PAS domain S-box protein n=1 Tax=Leptospira fletcheri TaxID=2484981 RepID=A0A4R9GJS4_9LEPT|nr:SpoIIE family protein phosphatase [Leptospira fletcheri]TGK13984.1 PAS domain S-box protein [Leptospira fletcheri]
MSEPDKNFSGPQAAFQSASRRDVIRILERITDAFLSLDGEFRIVYANFEAEHLLDVLRENLVGKRITEILPQFSGTPLFPSIVDARRTGIHKDLELLDPTDGTWYEVRLFPSHDDLAVYFRDVTARKLGEVKLRESEERLSELVRTSLEPILSLNSDMEIVLINPAAEALFGYSSWEVIRRHIKFLVPDRHKKWGSTVVQRLSETPDKGIFGPFRGKRKDGTEPILEVSVSKMRTSSGNGFTLIVRDVTERIRTERKLKNTVEKLRQVDRERNHLLHHLEDQVRERSKELSRFYKLMKEELSLAQRVQKSLLPPIDTSIRGASTFITYLPVMDVGGDWYDVFEVRPGILRILLADATGHGVQAALVTMTIKGVCEPIKYLAVSPSELLAGINMDYCRNFRSLQMYFSCFIMDIDVNRKELKFASAGHPAVFWKTEDETRLLERTGSLVGLSSEMKFGEEIRAYKSGDSLLMVTDGIFEEFDSEQHPFGEERIEAIYKTSGLEGKALHDRMLKDMKAHLGKREPQDDITLVSVALS